MIKKEGTLLIVDDNKGILMTLEILLAPYFNKIITLNSPNLIPTTLRENSFIDIVLLDMNFNAGVNTGGEGLYWLKEIKNINSNIAVVLFTAYADIELAVKAIKDGASDFVQKPWDNASLILTLQNALKLSKSEKQIKNMQAGISNRTDMFWGSSVVMKSLREAINKVADKDVNILIIGENGTGKDLLAREIHHLSSRSENMFVGVDMGAVTETLFESELFGHVKGSFTDAKTDRIGKFEAADSGTLFLDEIGNLPYHLQAKLLVTLQNRTITKVGSNNPIPIDIRLITATNRNLPQMVASGLFREDLLYRLNTILLEIPPLRERKEDIVPLSQLFLKRYCSKYGKKIEDISPSAKEKLQNAIWNGNIRELQHTIEKAVIMGDKILLEADDFVLNQQPNTVSISSTLDEMEKSMIIKAMNMHSQNMTQAAVQLGVTRQTLYNKIKKYEI